MSHFGNSYVNISDVWLAHRRWCSFASIGARKIAARSFNPISKPPAHCDQRLLLYSAWEELA